jgi:hypothetical protein
MDVYAYRDVLGRIKEAEKQFPGKGVEVAILQALLEQNESLQAVRRKIDRIMLCVEDINKK